MFNLFQKLESIYDCTNLNITSVPSRFLCSCAYFQIRLPLHMHLSTLSEPGQAGVICCYLWAISALPANVSRGVSLGRETSSVTWQLGLRLGLLGEAWVVLEPIGSVLWSVCKFVDSRNHSIGLGLTVARWLVALN